MKRLSLLTVTTTLLLPSVTHAKDANNNKKRPRFQVSLRSRLRIPGGSISSSIASTTIEEDEPPLDLAETFATSPKEDPFLKFNKKKGRITWDTTTTTSTATTSTPTQFQNATQHDPTFHSSSSSSSSSLSLSMDPFAAIRFLRILGSASRSFLVAFVGTLKLLGPLIFARRVLAQLGELVSDYMMGRYLRLAYEDIERKYWKEYQGPALTRSFARCLTHTIGLLWLGRFMEWMVGLRYPPCVIDNKGTCHWWCGLLWIVAVIGAGNLFAALITTQGPLQIKMTKRSLTHHHNKIIKRRTKRRSPVRILTRPLEIIPRKVILWMRDPDQWITDIATSRRDAAKSWKPFTPEPLLFPSTWPPLSILRNLAVAKAMASSSSIAVRNSMHVIMRQFLIQQAILDEWHRVLMDERRVGLGIVAMVIGFTASCFLFVTVAYADGISAVLMIPSLLATFSSGWMNLFVYWDRRRDRNEHRANLIVQRHPRSLGTSSYSIKW